MNLIVCIKRVPDLADVDIEIDGSGTHIRTADLTFGMNEWDRFAVEEAIRLKEEHGGSVTVLTVGDEASEDVLRRALAMGADEAVRLSDPAFEGADAWMTARILHAAVRARPFDLVLAGSVSSDSGSGVVGGMLAEMLGVPQVALATAVTVTGGTARVRHEVEGGMERVVDVDLPALVTVQTGINEPRYVSIRGIRKVADVVIPVQGAADLGLSPEPRRVTVIGMMRPPAGRRAELLEGDADAVAGQLADRLRQHGGLAT